MGFLYTCGSILNTIERITSTFDGLCHQTFHVAKTSLDTTESDSDDEEEYAIQRNKFRAPIYEPKPAQYLNCNDPMDQSLALQAVLNSFIKVCVWKKVVSFLGSLPVPLQHVDWKPDYTRYFNKKEEGDGQWHAEIRLIDPYGNIYDQGFVTKKISRRLSKYHKLSDICHPTGFKNKGTMGMHDDEARSSRSGRTRQYETVEDDMLPHSFTYHFVVDWNVSNQMGYGEEIDDLTPPNLLAAEPIFGC
ncbi:hypothetical protein Tco_0868140 [Tanacetum coccineum]